MKGRRVIFARTNSVTKCPCDAYSLKISARIDAHRMKKVDVTLTAFEQGRTARQIQSGDGHRGRVGGETQRRGTGQTNTRTHASLRTDVRSFSDAPGLSPVHAHWSIHGHAPSAGQTDFVLRPLSRGLILTSKGDIHVDVTFRGQCP